MDKSVEYHKLSYEEFSYINGPLCTHVQEMVRDYNFWYSGYVSYVKDQDMTKYVLERSIKHKHKFVFNYSKEKQIIYLVQYSKTFIKIYYCYSDKYSLAAKNINKAYERGKLEWEQKVLKPFKDMK